MPISCIARCDGAARWRHWVTDRVATGARATTSPPAIEIADIVWQPAGAERATLDLRGVRLRVPAGGLLVVCGPSGAGKTTTVGKLARMLKEGEKKSVMVVSADVYRPAAIEQLRTLANEVGVQFFP